jgi:hypothetical protein
MKVYGLWYGGSGYSHGDLTTDLERFHSIAAACEALSDRYNSNGHRKVEFDFANRDTEYVYCPCVERESSIWLWTGANLDLDTGAIFVPEYPDRIIEFGPRGGVRVTPA